MLKKLIKSERFIEFLRFSVNGAVCFLIDWSVMMLLMRFTGLPDWLSIAAGFLVSVVVNYLICIFWVFGGTKNQTVISKIIFLVKVIVLSNRSFDISLNISLVISYLPLCPK